MIVLKKAQVFKYKSIEDSTPVSIDKDVTVLVGKNESGKTAFLEALHKSLPLKKNEFNYVFDYPKKDYVQYLPKHTAQKFDRVVELTFSLGKETAEKINSELFAGEKVVEAGAQITRTTTYGNTNTIGLPVDQNSAMQALRKMLNGIDFVDELFEAAQSLETVIQNIKKKELPADHKLSKFVQEWEKQKEGAPDGWGLVSYRIWKNYVQKNLPCFLYFADYNMLKGKINLGTLSQRKESGQLSEYDETALGLFELAGTSLVELMSDEGYETSKAKLEAIGLSITRQIFDFWKQNQDLSVEFDIKEDPKDEAPYNTGKNLYIRVKNNRHGVTVPFDQRSKGFIWFFSFLVWFSSVQNRADTSKNLILLLDEPGLNLHALAQADFLSYIESLSKEHQIIYSTHSPFMVPNERFERVRVVEDRVKSGTVVTDQLEGSSDDSIFPLQAALGYSIAQNLFISKKNLLVEGPADLLLLQHMSSLLQQVGRNGLEEGTIIPVGGLDKLVTFISLLGANKLKLVVLHDRANAPHQKLEALIHQKLIERKRVLDYAMFRDPSGQETDIEDLFPVKLYVTAFNNIYGQELNGKKLDAKDLETHPRIVERINRWLKANDVQLMKKGGYNHYRIAQAILPMLVEKTVPLETIDTFEQIFAKINEALNS